MVQKEGDKIMKYSPIIAVILMVVCMGSFFIFVNYFERHVGERAIVAVLGIVVPYFYMIFQKAYGGMSSLSSYKC